jgi:ABC-type transport system substrate-binding protein
MRNPSRYAAKLLLMVVLAGVGLAVACSSAEEPKPAAAPAPASAPAPTAAPAIVAQPAPTEARTALEFTDGKRGGNMRIATGVWFDRWDMTTRSHWSSTQGLNRMYSGVLQFSPRDGLTTTPDLAKSWKLADDLSSVTLDFNEGIKWHDGEPFKVEDVIYTINRWTDPPKGTPQPRVAGFLLVDQMDKIDDQTLKITTKTPTSRILSALADSWHIILPEHVLEPEGGILSQPEQVIGTGPFKIEDWEVGNSVITVANPDYFVDAPDGSPYPFLDSITGISFANNELAGAALSTNQIDLYITFRADKAYGIQEDFPNEISVIRWDSPGYQGIALNASRPPFDDADVRKAFRCAIDTKQIVDLTSIPGVNPPNMRQISFFGTADPNYDDILSYPCLDWGEKAAQQAKAKQIFADKGVTKIEFLTEEEDPEIVLIVQQQMLPLGVDIDIVVTELTSAREQAYACDYELFWFGQAVASKSPVEIINQVFRPGAGFDMCQADPPQKWLDLLTDLDRVGLGSPEEKVITKQMDTIMREEWNPKVPVRRPDEFQIIWNYLKNVDPIPTSKFIQSRFVDAWLDEGAPGR